MIDSPYKNEFPEKPARLIIKGDKIWTGTSLTKGDLDITFSCYSPDEIKAFYDSFDKLLVVLLASREERLNKERREHEYKEYIRLKKIFEHKDVSG